MKSMKAIIIASVTVVGLMTGPVYAKRVALVIGNSDYQRAGDLRNPINDAQDLGLRLKQLGFELVGGQPQLNVTRSKLVRLVRKFGKMLDSGDTALVFYAGHGIGANGTNYLLPVDDGDIQSAEDLEDFAVGINSVMTRMSSRGEGTNIVILDACRNNPLPATTRGAGSGGLSRMSAPNGSFVAYAADPGAVAFDGDGQNGIFTGSLLAELKTPDRPLISIMRKVRRRVRSLTGGKQTPWTEESLEEAFFFADESSAPVVAAAPRPQLKFAPATSNGSGWFQPQPSAQQRPQKQWPQPTPAPQRPQQAAVRPTQVQPQLQPQPQPVAAQPQQPQPQPQQQLVEQLSLAQPAPQSAPVQSQQPAPVQLAALPQKSDVPARPETSMVPAPAAPQQVVAMPSPMAQAIFAYAGDMVQVGAGSFVMGIDESLVSKKNKSRRKPAPYPAHQVNIGYSLSVGRFEVTFDQWDACVADGRCAHQPDDAGEKRNNRPVMDVSWDDIQTYLAWLNAKVGLTGKPDRFRLPSEAEWEYFSRAGSRDAYPFSAEGGDVCSHANLFDNSTWREFPDLTSIDCRDGYARLAPVGEFAPNNFGLFDVIGNVSEWTDDCFHRNYKGAPANGQARTDGKKCGYRIIRGGSWFSKEETSSSFARKRSRKHLRHQDVGFRVVRTLKN